MALRVAPLVWVLACVGDADESSTYPDSGAGYCLPDSDFNSALDRDGALVPEVGAARWLTSSGLAMLEIRDDRLGDPGDFDDDVGLGQMALHTIDSERIHDCSVLATSGAVHVAGTLAACDAQRSPCTVGALQFDIGSLVFEDSGPIDGEFVASFFNE